MGTPGLGFETWTAFGKEVTFGTGVARTDIIEIITESLALASEPLPKASMRGFQSRGFFLPVKRAAGDLETELFYEGHEKLLEAHFGAVQTNIIEAGQVFDHVFTPAKSLPSLTLEINRDVTAFVYPGTKVNSLTLVQEIDQVLRATYGLVANDENPVPQAATGSLVFPDENLPVFHQAVLTIDAGTVFVDRFEVTSTVGLAERPKLGQRIEKEPVRNDIMTVEGTFVGDFEDVVEYNKFIAGTPVALKLEITGATIGTSDNFKVIIEVPRAVYSGETPQTGGPGLMKQNFPFRGYASEDLVTPAIRLTLRNTKSAV